MPPAGAPKDAQILAVGRRVLVACPRGKADRVTLTDDDGTTPLATLPVGTEVEIVGWYPRRAGGTRYRVLAATAGVEGWLGAASLKPRQLPPVPKPAAPAPPARLALPVRRSGGKVERDRRSPAAAKVVSANAKMVQRPKKIAPRQQRAGAVRAATSSSRTSKA
jgi:hypothetical protein